MAKDTKNKDPENVNSGSSTTETTPATIPEKAPDTPVKEVNNEELEKALSYITKLENSVKEEKEAKENALKQVNKLTEERDDFKNKYEESAGQVEELTKEVSELKKTSGSKKKKSNQPLIWKSEDGTEYSFTKNTPETFNHDGMTKRQEEWIEDKQAMQALVSGRSSFIIRIKK